MSEQTDLDRDGRHDFRSGHVSSDNPRIVDEKGHEFTEGRVAPEDEAERDRQNG